MESDMALIRRQFIKSNSEVLSAGQSNTVIFRIPTKSILRWIHLSGTSTWDAAITTAQNQTLVLGKSQDFAKATSSDYGVSEDRYIVRFEKTLVRIAATDLLPETSWEVFYPGIDLPLDQVSFLYLFHRSTQLSAASYLINLCFIDQ